MEMTMYKALKGVSASMETSMESTSEPTSSDGELTTKTGTTSESNTQETTSPAESSSNSSAPVGAIVGGVLGGLAILALIGFGLWFIRHKKRQAGNGSQVVATIDQPPVAPYRPRQSATHARGEVTISLWRQVLRLSQRRTRLLLTCSIRPSMKSNRSIMIVLAQLDIAEIGKKG
ncbi:hypothetical protein FVER14953_08623 [Fusarium verticillioides]|nr:hypothetical protein FVER14953_08623 [Fusarium verticillioides]